MLAHFGCCLQPPEPALTRWSGSSPTRRIAARPGRRGHHEGHIVIEASRRRTRSSPPTVHHLWRGLLRVWAGQDSPIGGAGHAVAQRRVERRRGLAHHRHHLVDSELGLVAYREERRANADTSRRRRRCRRVASHAAPRVSTRSRLRAELPGVAVAVAPDEADVTALMARIQSLPGVLHVEPDALSGTM